MPGQPGPLRVAFLADSLVVGGAERVIESLVLGLPEQGIETHVACLRSAGAIGDALAAAGVEVTSSLLQRRIDLGVVGRLASWLQRVDARVLYVLDHSNALFYGRLASRRLRIPNVVAVHRTRRADGSRSLGRVDRLLMPWTTAVVAVSQGHALYLREREGLPAAKLRVVHNGVDAARFGRAIGDDARRGAREALGLASDRTLVGVVAALRPEKNHEALLRVWSDPDLQGAELVVVGDGERRTDLENRATEQGVAARVHWLGWRSDVLDVMAAIDLLVLPSHPNVETFPLCVLEAMAAARPVVATRVGSLEEMVVDGRSGWLVDPGDDDALREALVQAVRDPELRRERGQEGRRILEARFDRERMIAATAAVLREVSGA